MPQIRPAAEQYTFDWNFKFVRASGPAWTEWPALTSHFFSVSTALKSGMGSVQLGQGLNSTITLFDKHILSNPSFKKWTKLPSSNRFEWTNIITSQLILGHMIFTIC